MASALFFSLLNMSDTEFMTLGLVDRTNKIMELAPIWYKPMYWANNIWIWSEFIVLLLNKRKRALHDYVAGTVVIQKKYETVAEQFYGVDSKGSANLAVAVS